MDNSAKVCIAGQDIIGVALRHYFEANGFEFIYNPVDGKVDLASQVETMDFLEMVKPDYVFLSHILDGGIAANVKSPADFIYTNLQVQNNIIHSSYKCGVRKLLYFGSSCMYPKDCPQPISEDYILTGSLEPTSEPYAVAKIAGAEMCRAYYRQYGAHFISCVPATVYGPGVSLDPEKSHVVGALITKIHAAKEGSLESVTLWGTGNPRREFIFCDDIVSASIFLMDNYESPEIVNAGFGSDVSIKELAFIIKDICGFKGDIIFDATHPDGVEKKLLDSTKINNMGWSAQTKLADGIKKTYDWYRKNYKTR